MQHKKENEPSHENRAVFEGDPFRSVVICLSRVHGIGSWLGRSRLGTASVTSSDITLG